MHALAGTLEENGGPRDSQGWKVVNITKRIICMTTEKVVDQDTRIRNSTKIYGYAYIMHAQETVSRIDERE